MTCPTRSTSTSARWTGRKIFLPTAALLFRKSVCPGSASRTWTDVAPLKADSRPRKRSLKRPLARRRGVVLDVVVLDGLLLADRLHRLDGPFQSFTRFGGKAAFDPFAPRFAQRLRRGLQAGFVLSAAFLKQTLLL